MSGKRICFKQHDITDCGAACLSSVASYYGLRIPLARIRYIAGTDQKGTNLMGMVEAAEQMGFQAKAIRTAPEFLNKIPAPFIAHIITRNKIAHYVVIYHAGKKYFKIMDPSSGSIERVSKNEFLETWTKILILLEPSTNFKQKNSVLTIWHRFFNLIKPHKSIILQTSIGALFYSILGLSTSVYIEKLIDHVIPSGNTNLLKVMTLALTMLLFFRIFIGWVKCMLMLQTGVKIDVSLITGYYQHILALPQRFFDTMKVGEIISRINDAVKIRFFLSNVATDLFIDLMIIIFTILLMISYSWKLGLILLAFLPVFLFIYLLYNKLNKKLLRRSMEHSASLESHMVESLTSIYTIKRFNLKQITGFQLETRFMNLLESAYKANKNSVYALNFNDLITNIAIIAIFWFGTKMVFSLEMTPGELMSFYALFAYLIRPINNLLSSNRIIQDAMIATDRLFQIMDLDCEIADASEIIIHKENFKGISFENVSFRYGTGRNILQDLNININPGIITGIAGESGSGKSTILSLIQGVYPVKTGKIKLGSYDLQYINKSRLTDFISIVPQKPDIFSASILDNISLFHPVPDIGKVLSLAEKVGMSDLIDTLPEGLHTMIGENGVNLSGGEKQKLAFARALYKDPELVLLDEATSSLDYKSERFIHFCVLDLKRMGKTVVIIAHKLSTLLDCDQIYYISKGRVIESGTHSELIKAKNDYFKFWQNENQYISLLE